MPKRSIALPPVHNTRAPEQWCIISQYVDFEGKTVLDLGCGYGDLLWRAVAAGAKLALGYENDWCIICETNYPLIGDWPVYNHIDLNSLPEKHSLADVAICFSVLPYLTDPTATLYWIREHSTQALIECQLAGDGPGFDWLKSPQDMRRWLDSIGWKSVQRIGETVIKDRGAKRGIWLCQ